MPQPWKTNKKTVAGLSSAPFSALEFVAAVAKAGAESRSFGGKVKKSEYKTYVTHLIYL